MTGYCPLPPTEPEPPGNFLIGIIIIAGVACIGWAMLGYVSELAGALF